MFVGRITDNSHHLFSTLRASDLGLSQPRQIILLAWHHRLPDAGEKHYGMQELSIP